MKINSINYVQSFRGNDEKAKSKSFMGHISDAIDNTTKAISSTAKVTDDLTDLVVSTKNAIDSPEEVTIRVLNNQLEKNVVNNEKTPSWVKKPATYLSAALISVLTFFATKKVVNAPGAVAKWTKGMLAKTEIGNSALRLAGVTKEAVSGLGSKVGEKLDLSALNPLKQKVANGFTSTKTYLAKKFPNVAHFVKGTADAIQLGTWTKSDYIKNGISVTVGATSGKEFVARHSDKLKDNKKEEVKTAKAEVIEPEVVDEDDEIRDAA